MQHLHYFILDKAREWIEFIDIIKWLFQLIRISCSFKHKWISLYFEVMGRNKNSIQNNFCFQHLFTLLMILDRIDFGSFPFNSLKLAALVFQKPGTFDSLSHIFNPHDSLKFNLKDYRGKKHTHTNNNNKNGKYTDIFVHKRHK